MAYEQIRLKVRQRARLSGIIPKDRLSELVSSHGRSARSLREYIRVLGLPQLSDKPGIGKRIMFAKHAIKATELFELTGFIAADLILSYKTWAEVRLAVEDPNNGIIKAHTENMLSEYGPIIWGESAPYMTVINPDFYPRYLVYNNLEDRARISACIYYIIRHLVLRKFYRSNLRERRGSSSGGNAQLCVQNSNASNMRACRLPAETGRIEEDTSSESDNDSSGEYCESRLPESPPEIATPPESVFLSGPSNTSRRLSSRALPARAVKDSNIATRLGACLGRSPPLPSSHIQQLTPLERLQKGFRKREQHSDPSIEPNARKMLCQSLLGLRERRSSGLPSRDQTLPRTRHGHRGQESQQRDFTASSSFTSSVCSLPTAPTSSRESLDVYIESQEGEDFLTESEEDTNQRSLAAKELSAEPTVLDNVTKTPIDVSTSTAPVEPIFSIRPMPRIQLVTKIDNYGNKYDCLTSELLDLLETCAPQNQNLASLKRTVQYIHEITTDTFGDNLEYHQGTLDRWMECINALIKFREATGLEGNRASWTAAMRNLTPEKRKVARATFFKARLGLSKWRKEPGFDELSEDLALLFFNIVDWAGMMELEELEELLRKFNEKLFAWFA